MAERASTVGTTARRAALAGRIDRRFELALRGTDVRTEALAGLTTFLTMAYIVVVNPAVLAAAGLPVAAVAAATCLAAGVASIAMGLAANVPLALAPGMGLNAYFSFVVVQTLHVPWPVALGCVFLSGLAFLVLTLAGVRQMIVAAIPPSLLAAVAGGIGLFIGFIGLRGAGIIVSSPATSVALGDLRQPGALVAIGGLVVIGGLLAWRVRGAVLIGILAAALLGWSAGLVHVAGTPYDLGAIRATAFRLDPAAALGLGGRAGLGLLEIMFVFLFVDLFDNVGTLVAVTRRAGLVASDGTIPKLDRMLLVDSCATMFGALVGTSTVTSYVESAAGVEAGGRTGLTAIVTGVLFLLAMPVAPLAQAIPAAATAPALILVGALMMAPLRDVAWDDPVAAISAFLTLALIPLTFSIATGLAFGLIAHAVLSVLRGKVRRSDWLLMLLATLLVARFAWLAQA